jgi:hypothetical protein
MFVRSRQSRNRLQLSLVETRRQAGKVVHEHVASLGSIIVPPAVSDRAAFWQKLHERLAKLSNRIDSETQGKILGAVHARIPMVTIEEIRAAQLENAQADERFWSRLNEMHESTAAGYTALRATADKEIADAQAGATQAKERAAVAKDRIDRLKKGDAVGGGLSKPMTLEDMAKMIGWTASDQRHANRLALIDTVPGAWDEYIKTSVGSPRRERAASLAFLKQLIKSGRLPFD